MEKNPVGGTGIHCVNCQRLTHHNRERHASGEYLLRCVRCGNWTLAKPKLPPLFLRKKKQKLFNENPISDDVRKATRLGEEFSGHTPMHKRRVAVKNAGPVRLKIGSVTGIMYLTRRDGKTEQYFHRFAKESRPQLVVTPDGKRLELLGGAFRFTERGIVDVKQSRAVHRKT